MEQKAKRYIKEGYANFTDTQILYENNQVPEATPVDLDYLNALTQTLMEWESEADQVAYKDLS